MSISVDHPTDRPNFSVVRLPGQAVWFSYHTPIAFQTRGHPPVVRENDWSATTGKHLNYIDNGRKADRIPGWRFERLLAEALAPDEGDGYPNAVRC